jgi:hypothetical protein
MLAYAQVGDTVSSEQNVLYRAYERKPGTVHYARLLTFMNLSIFPSPKAVLSLGQFRIFEQER